MLDRKTTFSSGQLFGDDDRADVGVGHAEVFGLAAGVAARHVRVAEQARGGMAHLLAAISAPRLVRSQSEYSVRWQYQHSPQEIVNGTTTRSPFFSFLTSLPTSTTTPIGSWPSTSPASIVGM